ncbi:MAG: RNA 2',3'-cyclic phosphodiesterase [Dehalococcoidia bacterium]|nr:RNA 2',3'-cyclic phosphodiesterase [Dehalococcoidia bacterium]MDD5495000.1 RNA 2',3'-cyclic phosphodiesterase [Dehalococcoidia bacterium]
MDEQIRSFIAIELPDELKTKLKNFQASLKLPKHNFVKWVSPDGIHITLKFLGNINNRQVDDINTVLASIAGVSKPFTVNTSEIGVFPNSNRVRVLWLGLNGDMASLQKLYQDIDKALAVRNFTSEKRPFTPHLTLARLRDDCLPNDRWEFGELVKDVKFEPGYIIKVEKLSFMRSRLLPGGAVYSKLAEFIFP